MLLSPTPVNAYAQESQTGADLSGALQPQCKLQIPAGSLRT